MVDKASEFCNRSMKSWLQDNVIEIYSTHKEENYFAAEKLDPSKTKFTNIGSQYNELSKLIN